MTIRPPIREVGKQTTVYGAGNLLSKLAVFLLIPIYTRFLSVTEVGIVALLEVMEVFLSTVVPFGINAALWRNLPETTGKEDQKKLIMSGFTGTLLADFVVLGIIALTYRSLAPFLGLTEADSWLTLIVIVNVFLGVGYRFILGLWQYEGRATRFVVLSLAQFVGVLLVTILFVVDFGWGIRGVVLARTIVYGAIFVVSAIFIVLPHLCVPSVAVYRSLVTFGAPLVLLALVTPVLTFSDRVFMRLYVSLEDIGIYSIAYKFGMLINMVLVIPLRRAWSPMMYRLGVGRESHEFHRDVLFYYAVTGAMIFLGVSLFSVDILKVAATREYLSGAYLIPVITLAYFFNGFRQFFVAGAALSNKTPRLAYAASGGVAVNLILNFFLIRYFGVPGAAWSTVISYVVLTSLVYLSSQSLVAIDWKWSRLRGLVIIMFAVYGLTLALQSWLESWLGLWAVLGIVSFPVLLWVAGIIGPRELKGFKSVLVMLKPGREKA
ncbi:MAG: oligosaccharide flippase family protein [Thermodesulfobacteriota bacterium]